MPRSESCWYKIQPLSTAKNIVIKSTFWWLKDILWNDTERDLDEDDLVNSMPAMQKQILSSKLERAWMEECEIAESKKRKSNLWKAILKVYIWQALGYSLFYSSFNSIQILQPVLLNFLISYFHSPTSTKQAFLLASTVVFFSIMETILKRQGFFQLSRIGLKIRVDCSSLMYRKLLRLSSTSTATESLINLMSNDVVKFENLCLYFPNVLNVPMQLMAMTYLVSCYVGTTAALCTSLTLMLLTFPGQAIFYKVMSKLRKKQTARTDKRISLISEVINGINSIKMYVWEHYFEQLIETARAREINVFFRMSYATSLVASPMNFTHQLCILFVVLACSMQNLPLSVSIIIPVMQLIWTLKENINYHFFAAIKSIVDANVSVKRIQNFLLAEEIKQKAGTVINEDNGNKLIRMKAVTAAYCYSKSCTNAVLKNINIEIESGKLCAVVGPVASGKSTLLKLILGEVNLVRGDLVINGKISYASQQPWLFGGSIRDNILFGENFDEKKYASVVEACALSYDFHQLPKGDETVVGERGAALSGGQCSRINLARAVYRRADVYLLDDPLSAVDSRVAQIIFDKCIKTLLKDKIRIFVTNNTSLLDRTDLFIVLNNGRIDKQGPSTKLQSSGSDYLNDLSTAVKDRTNDKHSEDNQNEFIDKRDKPAAIAAFKDNGDDEEDEREELILKKNESIPKSLYWRYFKASQAHLAICSWILNCILVVCLLAGFDYWTVTWVQKHHSNVSISNYSGCSEVGTNVECFFDNFTYVSTILIAGTIVTSILKNISLYNVALNASKNLHKNMFSRVIKAPLQFFINNPSGRILNRFSQDTGSVDDLLTSSISDSSDCFVLTIACLIAIVIVAWWHLLSMLVIAFFYYQLYKLFAPAIRKVKRLEGSAKSPVLSSVTSSYAGAVTIRSCRSQELVIKGFHARQARHTAARFLILAMSQAYSLWLDLTTSTLLAVVTYSCVLLNSSNLLDGAYAALSLLQVLNISTNMSFTIKQLTETLAHMINVERMIEYTTLDEEQSAEAARVALPLNWPSDGRLTFDHLHLRYSDEAEPVLKDLTFSVEPGAKVGVVGRTGAGKSSLISALFRLASTDGSLCIDGVDVKGVDLKRLRSKISVIPQEPVVFDGSLRCNLDPFNECEDASLWSALEDVELKRNFASLNCSIDQAGRSLSSGQKQLLSLARAIVRNNRILILDEATANVDSATDALIQKTIRSKFAACTVLTIAHKLMTVMDSDRILVMNGGAVVEYDQPYLLLQKTGGELFKMVQRTGYAHSRQLFEIAKNASLAASRK